MNCPDISSSHQALILIVAFTIAYFVAPSLFSHRIRPSFVTNIVHNTFNGFNITNGTNKRIDDDSDDNGGYTICLADIILDDSSS